MRITLFICLLVLGLVLFFAKKRIDNDTLQRLANAFAVVSFIAAALTLVIPAPISTAKTPNLTAPVSTIALQASTQTIPGNAVIELSQVCSPISPCECTWEFQSVGFNFPDTMRDTFTLRNTGTGNLELSQETSSCSECLAGWHNPENRNIINPGGHTQFFVEYSWNKDPLQGASHNHIITVYSNASNCPVLTINVPITYK